VGIRETTRITERNLTEDKYVDDAGLFPFGLALSLKADEEARVECSFPETTGHHMHRRHTAI